jgi:hypothetical protein
MYHLPNQLSLLFLSFSFIGLISQARVSNTNVNPTTSNQAKNSLEWRDVMAIEYVVMKNQT